jgi:CheY-like chemotaxis protein
MSRILLVDDSPHAQRMGERILTEEGYEVVTVSNADSALIRLEDVDPDVVLADTVMPGRTGFEICQYLKMSPRHRHVRVVLTAGALDPLDEEQTKRVEADGILKKPFEASALLAVVKPLAEAAAKARADAGGGDLSRRAPDIRRAAMPFVAVVDAEQIRAAVTIALDGAMEKIIDEVTQRVLSALSAGSRSQATSSHSVPEFAPISLSPAAPAPPDPAAPDSESVRRVNPVRRRSGSILGLDLDRGRPAPPASPKSC